MVEVSASILSIQPENAIQTLYNLETAKIDYFHIDVMDGKFVENNTTTKMTEYCEYLNSISNLPLDVHLMVEDVESYIHSFSIFEPNIVTFHLEAGKDKEQIMKWIQMIKDKNIRVGISVKPNTNIEEIYGYLPYIHLVLVMTVEPGKGGQELILETIDKIRKLHQYIQKNGLEVDIEADGGINTNNASIVTEAGANMIVSGSAIVGSDNYVEVVSRLKNKLS